VLFSGTGKRKASQRFDPINNEYVRDTDEIQRALAGRPAKKARRPSQPIAAPVDSSSKVSTSEACSISLASSSTFG
jgi:hypothetical protein